MTQEDKDAIDAAYAQDNYGPAQTFEEFAAALAKAQAEYAAAQAEKEDKK